MIRLTNTPFWNKIILSIGLLLISFIAKGQHFDEYELKSGYIFNFQNFVSWPKKAIKTDIISLNIYGESEPYDKILVQMAQLKNRPDAKWLISHQNKLDQTIACDILFITQVKPSDVPKILALVKGMSILTIGDKIPNFCEMGGMINFLPSDAKKPFEINKSAAEAVKISISSKLLSISKVIQ